MVLNLDQMQNFVQNVGTNPKEILNFYFISLFLISFFNYFDAVQMDAENEINLNF